MKSMKLTLTTVVSLLLASAAQAAPNVSISKSCPGLRYLSRNATFEITVSNTGDSVAENVMVTDVIPSGLDFVSVEKPGKREGGRITWNIGNLEAGQSRVLKTHYRCNRIGKFKNHAKVTYCASAEDECEIEVKGISAILLECVDSPDPIELNGNVTYTIEVTNQGSAVGTNIGITCTLPDEEDYASSTGPTNANVDGRKVTFAPLPSLAPRAKAVYKVTVKGVGVGDVRFRVEMTSDQIGEPVMETESTRIYD